ncbi:unnamed protein product [Soboliphyme baturini]|uniref:Secreted protein n=1 Tax=Soboliphyme baturini TaxID=241478 RepID=A0A183IES2_9BILA|nr:unnamed protein product [Soboliphyme baturini]
MLSSKEPGDGLVLSMPVVLLVGITVFRAVAHSRDVSQATIAAQRKKSSVSATVSQLMSDYKRLSKYGGLSFVVCPYVC